MYIADTTYSYCQLQAYQQIWQIGFSDCYIHRVLQNLHLKMWKFSFFFFYENWFQNSVKEATYLSNDEH